MRLPLYPILLAIAGCGGPPPEPPAQLDSAVEKYPDLRTLWGRAMDRTCGPNSGVCHNDRQFPDMQTASGLLRAVGLRCNQIRDNPAAVDNLCEPPGDSLSIGSFSTRIGNVTAVGPAAMPTALTLSLHDALPMDVPATAAASIVRSRDGLKTVTFALPARTLMAGKKGDTTVTLAYAPLVMAPGPTATVYLAKFLLPPQFLPGDDTQIELGDPNGDGVFGHDLGGALIKPGDPMKSYLFLRVLGPLAVGPGAMNTNVAAAASTEVQMPIANFQYWDIDNAVTALWCWISGIKPDGSNADGPIDYANCDLTHRPSPTHQGGEAVTFSAIYDQILQPSCAGPCHHTSTDQPTVLWMDSPQETYDVLLGISGRGPFENKAMLPFVTRNDPMSSYLYLKLIGKGIEGAQMPLNGSLPQSSIDSVGNWISQGANNN
jgi:hypothetical protein